MDKLTQEQLDKAIQHVVPGKYKPVAKGGGKPPAVVEIKVLSDAEFDARVSRFNSYPNLKTIRAVTINLGLVGKRVNSPIWQSMLQSHSIYFRETFPSNVQLNREFVLLHEIGHVDWNNEYEALKTLWKKEEMEHYCNLYATDIMAKTYSPKLADIVRRGYSAATPKVHYDA